MRGVRLACFVLFVGVVAAAPQEEGATADITTTKPEVVTFEFSEELQAITLGPISDLPAVPTTAEPVTVEAVEAVEVSEEDVTTGAPPAPTPAPAPVITKQINEINEDGTYTVGFEAADGTFKLETRDEEGNVKGKYGYLDGNGDLIVVEYSSNNSTGFITDREVPVVASLSLSSDIGEGSTANTARAGPQQTPEFELEKERHAAVLALQARVVEAQKAEAARRQQQVARRQFANQPGARRRPVFNAANFNPNAPLDQQFDQRGFNQQFNQFQQQQQFAQQQPQQPQTFRQPQQQFAPRQQQQFSTNFAPPNQFDQQFFGAQQGQLFAQQEQPRRQFAPRPPQQFAPQQPPQFAPQQPAPVAALIPASELTEEDIRLHGFSRDENQDGQVDPLPAHLAHLAEPLPAPAPPLAPQTFRQPQQPQTFRQPQFRQPAPVAPGNAQPQLSQAQLNQLFAQQQQQQFAPQQLSPQQQFRQQEQAFFAQFANQEQQRQPQQFSPQQRFPPQQQRFSPQQAQSFTFTPQQGA